MGAPVNKDGGAVTDFLGSTWDQTTSSSKELQPKATQTTALARICHNYLIKIFEGKLFVDGISLL